MGDAHKAARPQRIIKAIANGSPLSYHSQEARRESRAPKATSQAMASYTALLPSIRISTSPPPVILSPGLLRGLHAG